MKPSTTTRARNSRLRIARIVFGSKNRVALTAGAFTSKIDGKNFDSRAGFGSQISDEVGVVFLEIHRAAQAEHFPAIRRAANIADNAAVRDGLSFRQLRTLRVGKNIRVER